MSLALLESQEKLNDACRRYGATPSQLQRDVAQPIRSKAAATFVEHVSCEGLSCHTAQHAEMRGIDVDGLSHFL